MVRFLAWFAFAASAAVLMVTLAVTIDPISAEPSGLTKSQAVVDCGTPAATPTGPVPCVLVTPTPDIQVTIPSEEPEIVVVELPDTGAGSTAANPQPSAHQGWYTRFTYCSVSGIYYRVEDYIYHGVWLHYWAGTYRYYAQGYC